MLYSKTSNARTGDLRPLLLTTMFVLAQMLPQITQAQANNLISGDMGFTSSESDDDLANRLINPDDTAQSVPATPNVSPAEAAELVRNNIGGQVMSVHTHTKDSGVIYGVKVLNAGRMRVINVDGQTGQLLNR
jgi:hypothetical protein